MKTYGNIVLMAVICIVIFWVFMPFDRRMLTLSHWESTSAAARIGAIGRSPASVSVGAKAGVQTALREITGPVACCNVAEACDETQPPLTATTSETQTRERGFFYCGAVPGNRAGTRG